MFKNAEKKIDDVLWIIIILGMASIFFGLIAIAIGDEESPKNTDYILIIETPDNEVFPLDIFEDRTDCVFEAYKMEADGDKAYCEAYEQE